MSFLNNNASYHTSSQRLFRNSQFSTSSPSSFKAKANRPLPKANTYHSAIPSSTSITQRNSISFSSTSFQNNYSQTESSKDSQTQSPKDSQTESSTGESKRIEEAVVELNAEQIAQIKMQKQIASTQASLLEMFKLAAGNPKMLSAITEMQQALVKTQQAFCNTLEKKQEKTSISKEEIKQNYDFSCERTPKTEAIFKARNIQDFKKALNALKEEWKSPVKISYFLHYYFSYKIYLLDYKINKKIFDENLFTLLKQIIRLDEFFTREGKFWINPKTENSSLLLLIKKKRNFFSLITPILKNAAKTWRDNGKMLEFLMHEDTDGSTALNILMSYGDNLKSNTLINIARERFNENKEVMVKEAMALFLMQKATKGKNKGKTALQLLYESNANKVTKRIMHNTFQKFLEL